MSHETLRKHGISHIPWELMNNATDSNNNRSKNNASVTNVTAEAVVDGAI
jgi:hypothetical protein